MKQLEIKLDITCGEEWDIIRPTFTSEGKVLDVHTPDIRLKFESITQCLKAVINSHKSRLVSNTYKGGLLINLIENHLKGKENKGIDFESNIESFIEKGSMQYTVTFKRGSSSLEELADSPVANFFIEKTPQYWKLIYGALDLDSYPNISVPVGETSDTDMYAKLVNEFILTTSRVKEEVGIEVGQLEWALPILRSYVEGDFSDRMFDVEVDYMGNKYDEIAQVVVGIEKYTIAKRKIKRFEFLCEYQKNDAIVYCKDTITSKKEAKAFLTQVTQLWGASTVDMSLSLLIKTDPSNFRFIYSACKAFTGELEHYEYLWATDLVFEYRNFLIGVVAAETPVDQLDKAYFMSIIPGSSYVLPKWRVYPEGLKLVGEVDAHLVDKRHDHSIVLEFVRGNTKPVSKEEYYNAIANFNRIGKVLGLPTYDKDKALPTDGSKESMATVFEERLVSSKGYYVSNTMGIEDQQEYLSEYKLAESTIKNYLNPVEAQDGITHEGLLALIQSDLRYKQQQVPDKYTEEVLQLLNKCSGLLHQRVEDRKKREVYTTYKL